MLPSTSVDVIVIVPPEWERVVMPAPLNVAVLLPYSVIVGSVVPAMVKV